MNEKEEQLMTTHETVAVPADDEWFELEVDNDIDPMDVVRTAGYDLKDWKYLGPKLEGKQKYRAKLIHLGYVGNLAEARECADKIGYRLLEGQAREPFKKKYPKPDRSPVIFGGSGWQRLGGRAIAACLRAFGIEWDSDFHWSGHGFFENCRWAAVSK